jgi:serine/threonine-protein phosphatase 2A regulatory subunit A
MDETLESLLSKSGRQSLVEELELLVGLNENSNRTIVEHLNSASLSPEYLPVCSLLLLESPDSVIHIIQKILLSSAEKTHGFITALLDSPYYLHRRAVPQVLVDMDYPGTGEALRRCLDDPAVPVISSAVLSLREYKTSPFTDDELAGIAMQLNNHPSEYVQCLMVDVLVLIGQSTPLIQEACVSSSWRKRYALAKSIPLLKSKDRKMVYEHLLKDGEDEIRTRLADNLGSLEDWEELASELLKDSSATVRALTVRKVGQREELHHLLGSMVSDPSWEVRKELLCVQKTDTYRSIAIPLINSLNSTPSWRVRKEVLESIAQISKHNEDLLREYLDVHLMKYLHDKVHEIRAETARIIKELVEMYDWTHKWEGELSAAVCSRNFLHRITAADAALAFDKKHGTGFMKRLLEDPIDNVRLCALGMLIKDKEGGKFVGSEEVRAIVEELSHSDDDEVRRAAEELLDLNEIEAASHVGDMYLS